MKNYKFLIKPLFYIFSLLLSSWMVLFIDEIQNSSDVHSKHESKNDRSFLKEIILEYKNGAIDSVTMDRCVQDFLISQKHTLNQQSKYEVSIHK